MKRILILSILFVSSIGILKSQSDWTGKFRLAPDPNNGNCFLLQVVPDNDGTSEIAASGTVAYLVVPDGLDYTTTDINGTFTTTTLGNVADVTTGCGDLVQATMESDYNEADGWQAGEIVDLVRFCINDTSTCPTSAPLRLMDDPTDQCDGIQAGFLDQGLQTASNSGAYTGNVYAGGAAPICSAILPVELLSFNATLSGADGSLTWSTATETDNDRFEVERSLDGVSWAYIGQVAGAGNSATTLDYDYIDQNITDFGTAEIYYRLKQVDFDGSFDYSNIELINLSGKSSLDIISLDFGNAWRLKETFGEGIDRVDIYNALGNIESSIRYGNVDVVDLETSNLSAGTYMLVINGKHRKKLIIAR